MIFSNATCTPKAASLSGDSLSLRGETGERGLEASRIVGVNCSSAMIVQVNRRRGPLVSAVANKLIPLTCATHHTYAVPIARLTAAALVLAALIASVAAGAASAATTLPDVDTRARDSGPVAPGARQARRALERRLGGRGVVSTDGVSGGARLVARTDDMLTARSADDPAEVALDYVGAHATAFGLDDDELGRLRLTSRYRSGDGVTHLAWTQTAAGIAAYDNVLYANVARDGRLVNISGSAVGGLAIGSTTPALGAARALAAAKRDVGGALVAPRATQQPGLERATRFSSGDDARLTIFSDGHSERLAWRVLVTGEHGFLYEVVVDAAGGDVLLRRSLTHFASTARIHRNHPGAASGGTPELVDLAADPSWLSMSGNVALRGNNAWAYADFGGSDGFDPGEDIPPSSGTDWDYPLVPFAVSDQSCPSPGCTWDSTDPTTRATNRNQATTQLFWFVNTFHDHLRAPPIGFTHEARGFEFTDADGPGGAAGGDHVLAESDNLNPSSPETIARTTNTAYIIVPPDGLAPQLSTHLFSNPSLNAADLADVVYHEYAHGLTNRSVGTGRGMGARQSRALGEGWSDWYALDYLVAEGLVPDDAALDGELSTGAYLVNSFGTDGVRRQGLDCPVGSAPPACPGSAGAGPGGFSLGDMGRVGAEFNFHDDGEIWSETLWDLRRALGSQTARALITGGLRLAPDNPSFIDARNAILQADRVASSGANHDVLWQVFAGRGMGYSASTSGSAAVTAREAFDLPPPPPPPPP